MTFIKRGEQIYVHLVQHDYENASRGQFKENAEKKKKKTWQFPKLYIIHFNKQTDSFSKPPLWGIFYCGDFLLCLFKTVSFLLVNMWVHVTVAELCQALWISLRFWSPLAAPMCFSCARRCDLRHLVLLVFKRLVSRVAAVCLSVSLVFLSCCFSVYFPHLNAEFLFILSFWLFYFIRVTSSESRFTLKVIIRPLNSIIIKKRNRKPRSKQCNNVKRVRSINKTPWPQNRRKQETPAGSECSRAFCFSDRGIQTIKYSRI